MGGYSGKSNTGRGRYEDIPEMEIKDWRLFSEKHFRGGLVLSEEIFSVGLVGYVLGSLFQAPREKREGEGEGTKTREAGHPRRFRPLALSFARLSRSLEQATFWVG